MFLISLLVIYQCINYCMQYDPSKGCNWISNKQPRRLSKFNWKKKKLRSTKSTERIEMEEMAFVHWVKPFENGNLRVRLSFVIHLKAEHKKKCTNEVNTLFFYSNKAMACFPTISTAKCHRNQHTIFHFTIKI